MFSLWPGEFPSLCQRHLVWEQKSKLRQHPLILTQSSSFLFQVFVQTSAIPRNPDCLHSPLPTPWTPGCSGIHYVIWHMILYSITASICSEIVFYWGLTTWIENKTTPETESYLYFLRFPLSAPGSIPWSRMFHNLLCKRCWPTWPAQGLDRLLITYWQGLTFADHYTSCHPSLNF